MGYFFANLNNLKYEVVIKKKIKLQLPDIRTL